MRKLTVNVAEFPPVLLSQPASQDFSMYPATPATLPVLHPGTSLFFPVTANVLTATQAMNYISSPTPDVTVRPDRGFSDITPSASQQVQDFQATLCLSIQVLLSTLIIDPKLGS